MRNYRVLSFVFIALSGLTACTQAPPVTDSREVLWAQFGNQPLDEVLRAWGVPTKETHLSDGARLVTYRRSTSYESRFSSQQGAACEVSFMAKAPQFVIGDIAMQGAPNECRMLAKGRIGDVVVPAPEPMYPYGMGAYPYRSYPF